jgi:hypothetical protein
MLVDLGRKYVLVPYILFDLFCDLKLISELKITNKIRFVFLLSPEQSCGPGIVRKVTLGILLLLSSVCSCHVSVDSINL